MKAIKFLVSVAVLELASAGCATAQTIHLITVADSFDANIGTGAAANTRQVEDFVKAVAFELRLPLKRQDIAGKEFNCQRIQAEIEALTAGNDDVVIFYYSGHGFRTPENITKFPELYCGPEAFSGGAPRLKEVATQLQDKGARLTIAIADACNVLISQPARPARPGGIASVPVTRVEPYRTLFLRHKGTLVISGSIKDQYSWYLPTTGLFTSQFVAALEAATRPGKQGVWTEVLPAALKEIKVPFGNTTVPQKPESESTIVRVP